MRRGTEDVRDSTGNVFRFQSLLEKCQMCHLILSEWSCQPSTNCRINNFTLYEAYILATSSGLLARDINSVATKPGEMLWKGDND